MPKQTHGDPCVICGGFEFHCSECGDWTYCKDEMPPKFQPLELAVKVKLHTGETETQVMYGYFVEARLRTYHIYAWRLKSTPPPLPEADNADR